MIDDGSTCLACKLPVCDEDDRGCRWTQIFRPRKQTKREQEKIRKHEWYLRNREATIARSMAYYESNKEKCKIQKMEWRKTHNPDRREYFKKYYRKKLLAIRLISSAE